MYFEHVVRSLCNTCFFSCQFSNPHMTTYDSNIGAHITVVFDFRHVYVKFMKIYKFVVSMCTCLENKQKQTSGINCWSVCIALLSKHRQFEPKSFKNSSCQLPLFTNYIVQANNAHKSCYSHRHFSIQKKKTLHHIVHTETNILVALVNSSHTDTMHMSSGKQHMFGMDLWLFLNPLKTDVRPE